MKLIVIARSAIVSQISSDLCILEQRATRRNRSYNQQSTQIRLFKSNYWPRHESNIRLVIFQYL